MAKRKQFTPEQKVKILKEHLSENKQVSDICDRYEISPVIFYRWQKHFFEKGFLAFQKDNDKQKAKLEKKIIWLEKKINQKNEVLSELMEEHVALKKSLGEI